MTVLVKGSNCGNIFSGFICKNRRTKGNKNEEIDFQKFHATFFLTLLKLFPSFYNPAIKGPMKFLKMLDTIYSVLSRLVLSSKLVEVKIDKIKGNKFSLLLNLNVKVLLHCQ